MKEPKTELGKVLFLITMPIRIVWWIFASLFEGLPK